MPVDEGEEGANDSEELENRELKNLTRKLVSIESFSGEEEEILRWIKEYVDDKNSEITTKLDAFDPGNLDAPDVSPQSGEGPMYNLEIGNVSAAKLLIVTHADTVDYDEEEWDEGPNPLGGDIEDGKLYGRGAVDSKSTIAAGLLAVCDAYSEHEEEPPVAMLVESDEEREFRGMQRFLERHEDESFDTELVVIGVPTGLDIENRQRGLYHADIQVGMSHEDDSEVSHAARAQVVNDDGEVERNGPHAIVKAQPVLDALVDFQKYTEVMQSTNDNVDDDFRPLTFTISTMHAPGKGGGDNNRIPSKCRIETDSRVPDRHESANQAEILEEYIYNVETDDDVEVVFDSYAVFDALEIPEDHQAVQDFEKAARNAGCSPSFEYTEFFSELAHWREEHPDVPGIVFGPGPREKAHALNEHVRIEDVGQVKKTFDEAIKAFQAE